MIYFNLFWFSLSLNNTKSNHDGNGLDSKFMSIEEHDQEDSLQGGSPQVHKLGVEKTRFPGSVHHIYIMI